MTSSVQMPDAAAQAANHAATQQVAAELNPYARAIYQAVRRQVDPAGGSRGRLSRRWAVLGACRETMLQLAAEPGFDGRLDRRLFDEIRHHFPLAAQAHVAWAIEAGLAAAAVHVERRHAAGVYEVVRRCAATGYRGKPCEREPKPGRRFCPVHKKLERLEA